MTRKVGLEVIEGIAAGLASFKDPSKRNIGLLMERERGVPLKVRMCVSIEDDNKFFGGFTSNTFGAYVVKSMFDNAPPAPLKYYGARVVGAGTSAATAANTILSTATTFTAGFRGEIDPGIWGNSLVVKLYSYDMKARNKYLLEVLYKGKIVETFEETTSALLLQAINKRSGYVVATFAGPMDTVVLGAVAGTATSSVSSTVITGVGTTFTSLAVGTLLYTNANVYIGKIKSITSATSLILTGFAAVAVAGASVKNRLDSVYTATLAGGTYVSPVESAFYPVPDPVNPTGIAVFDGYDVQMIATTENHSKTMAVQLSQYCASRKDCIGIVNLPMNADEGVIEDYANSLQTTQRSFIAGYLDWFNVYNQNGDIISIPGIGGIIGAAFIRATYLQGDYVHIPPAGVESAFVNVVSLVSGRLSQSQIDSYVQDYTTNVSKSSDNYGTFVLSSRTYSTNPLYSSIHIAMQTNFYVKLLNTNMVFLLQKPNTPELKKEAKIKIIAYFKLEYERGALERAISFEEAFIVQCDQGNNPLSQDRKLLNIDIEYIPTECTESVKISLNRNDAFLTTKVNSNA